MSDPEPPSPVANAPAEPQESTFDDLPLHPTLRRGVRDMGYRVPTPIQRSTIPEAITGRDLIGTAQTGSGKTAAFLLPILERLMHHPSGRTYALILTPTRELALQAEGFLRQLGRHTRIRGAAVYGGVGMEPQERALRGGAEVIVATPGRLLDHMSRGYVDFRSLEVLVLDEADRMLDMGFIPDVRRILRALPSRRQTMLFSATMPPEVVQLSRDFLHEPRMVRVEEATVAAAGVRHRALAIPQHQKTDLLAVLLKDPSMESVLIFTRTKHRADRLLRSLHQLRIDAGVIHGNKSQSQRVKALEAFRRGTHRVLVATDIAARGIDVEGISHVVNFDAPQDPETYVHRVGRTARAQRQGEAISFVTREDEDEFSRIEQFLGESIPRERLEGFRYEEAPRREAPSFGRGGHGGRGRASPRGGGHRPAFSNEKPSYPATHQRW
ncbi:MAG: DEAD/DEAH box helicase [Euryarchaeota archaeon]|nr:DEAD/DEAH box helicase [Euryarchaeota archaeon]MDE1835504.1 DEAD/DEAH box helicase [Euryarchaeota archaeon]MDE1880397.1 DEAD/DEAH box helicase [Euryarchaeota archaeon]MDE2045785.1 DEAD/DEAH box helicase [Thermoplasmata archaeon]